MRVRDRLRESRHRLLGRLRGLDGPAGPTSEQDQLLQQWERFEKEVIAEEAERLAREHGLAEAELEHDWSLLAEQLFSDQLPCPLCQAAAQLTAQCRLSCRCGLSVCAPSADPHWVRRALSAAAAAHEAVCAEPELFYSQCDGQLTVLCASCGLHGPAFP
ncbi:hypothetical protein FJT64_010364 [Amphibalanus amphitrite]|uniref:RPA-interacting protein C-terminal domain-containing protein n=1 Tax=Amphibalanus amphitrite TaxID=1232801 RepID=A0A6A4VCG6_AMPAM|nr:hypothetical protein FJT64_010364 [Amphibalanus amphitrite]